MVLFGRPVQLTHRDLSRVHDIQQLHSDGTIARLLNLRSGMVHKSRPVSGFGIQIQEQEQEEHTYRLRSRVAFIQSTISFLPTKKAPSIIPMFDIMRRGVCVRKCECKCDRFVEEEHFRAHGARCLVSLSCVCFSGFCSRFLK